MIVQIVEQFHDYEKQVYFIETDRLKPEANPIDAMVLKACKKKAHEQEVYIDARKYQNEGADDGFWDDPQLTNAEVKKKTLTPEKTIFLTIDFDC